MLNGSMRQGLPLVHTEHIPAVGDWPDPAQLSWLRDLEEVVEHSEPCFTYPIKRQSQVPGAHR